MTSNTATGLKKALYQEFTPAAANGTGPGQQGNSSQQAQESTREGNHEHRGPAIVINLADRRLKAASATQTEDSSSSADAENSTNSEVPASQSAAAQEQAALGAESGSASASAAPVEQTAGDPWEQCRELAQEHDILARLVEEMHAAGVVGEDRNLKLLFLALTSRVLDQPISLVVKGLSSAGKSFLTERILPLFPPEAYDFFTSASPKFLFYTDASYEHRMLIFAEAAGMQHEEISYIIRTLLSEGRLEHKTLVRVGEQWKAKTFRKDGPTGLITSTTAVVLHKENETRYFSLVMNETAAQTRAILKATAAEDKVPIDPAPWRALQLWISQQPAKVSIPYAPVLADLIYAEAERMRRDFKRLLNLISTTAILHQATRDRDEEGRIVATMQDYQIAYDLVSDLMAYGVQATVPPRVRRLVEAVKALTATGQTWAGIGEDQPTTTETAVANLLEVHKSRVSRIYKEAQKLGYIVNLESKPGRPARLCLGDPLPEDTAVLPSPEQLLAAIEGEQRLAA